ncbi:MAG: hypothetical protein ACFFDH_03385 [Promethearchaeota archaeon]
MIEIDFSIMNRKDVKIKIERLDVVENNPPNYFYIISFKYPKNKEVKDYGLEIALSPEQLEILRNLLEKEVQEI